MTRQQGPVKHWRDRAAEMLVLSTMMKDAEARAIDGAKAASTGGGGTCTG